MKLAFLSDFHIGFSQPEREREAFHHALAALRAAAEEEPDAIVFTGDFFHREIPAQETLLEAFRLLAVPHSAKGSNIGVEKERGKGREKMRLEGIPFIAIHGTHEFRGRDFANILEVVESAGFLVYLHAATATLTKHREVVVLHGLGGVPEKKARDVLKRWSPKPVEGAFNILLLHQSFKEFLPFHDDMVATLSLSDIPKGFDLVVDGHLHWNSELREAGIHIIMPGSTVVTQMKNLESRKKKGFYLLDTKADKLKFVEIPGQRPFHYRKVEFSGASGDEVKERAVKELNKLALGAGPVKPLVRLKLTGTLAKGFSASDLDLSSVEESFRGKAIVTISSSFREESFRKKIKDLSKEQEQRKSISELGLEILERNLEETDFTNAFDSRRVFELLKANETEKALEILSALKPGHKRK